MPIRKFCDLCDTEIKADDRSWRLDMSELDSPEASHYYDRKDFHILIGKNWEFRSAALNVAMICASCAKSVIQHIYAELKPHD